MLGNRNAVANLAVRDIDRARDFYTGTLGLKEVCSAPQTANPRSWRVCDRLSMRFQRVVTLAPTPRRGAVDVNLYWVTKDEWAASVSGRRPS